MSKLLLALWLLVALAPIAAHAFRSSFGEAKWQILNVRLAPIGAHAFRSSFGEAKWQILNVRLAPIGAHAFRSSFGTPGEFFLRTCRISGIGGSARRIKKRGMSQLLLALCLLVA